MKLLTALFAIAMSSLPATLGAARAESLGPTLQKIKDAGAIALGVRDDFVPFAYRVDDKRTGFAVELCDRVVDKVKAKLGLTELKVNYETAAPAALADKLKAGGSIDLDCGAVPTSKARENEMAFSIAIFTPELKWLISRRSATRNGLSLLNKTVVLNENAATTKLVLELSNQRSLGLSILKARSTKESFQMVERGQAAALLDDDVVVAGMKAATRNPDAYAFLEEKYPADPYALALPQGDPAFKQTVDAALSETMTSGEFEKLYTKWFESPIPPKNVNLKFPMPDKLKALIKHPNEKTAQQ